MAGRRKKSPPNAVVESIIWRDASMEMREKLDTSPVIKHTVGFVVHDDKDQVILAHEVSVVEDWLDDFMDYTKIPVGLILKRVKLAEIPVQEDLEVILAEEILTPKTPDG